MTTSWLPSSIIYQIFTGRWEAETSASDLATSEVESQKTSEVEPGIHKQDTFQSLKNRDWQCLKDLGINTLYFLGLWDSRGPVIVHEEEGIDLFGKQPRIPSVFAITDHISVHPDLGNLQDFKALLDHLHSLDFKIIVDFIPNHTSTVHPWTQSHPEFYYPADQPPPSHLTTDPSIQNHGQSFFKEFSGDVYKLNYQNPELRQQMIYILENIASLGVDGVRVDVPYKVPLDFWQQTIPQIKQPYPDFAFIGEVYPLHHFDYRPIHDHLQAGFNAVYNKGTYEDLQNILLHHQPLSWLAANLNALSTNFPSLTPSPYTLTPSINFFSNHDEQPPVEVKSSSQMSNSYIEALLSVILFTPGIPFLYNGSLLGLDHRLAHHWFEPLPSLYLETANPLPDNLVQLFKLRRQRHPQGVPFDHFHVETKDEHLTLKNRDHQGQEYEISINFNAI
jgi:glycosidase